MDKLKIPLKRFPWTTTTENITLFSKSKCDSKIFIRLISADMLISKKIYFSLDKFNKCESGSSSHKDFIYNYVNQKLSITGIKELCIERNTIAWVILAENFS